MKQKTMRIIITDNDHVHNEHAHVVYDDAKQQEVPTKATKSVTYLKETRIEQNQFQRQAISQFHRQPKGHYRQNTILKPKKEKK